MAWAQFNLQSLTGQPNVVRLNLDQVVEVVYLEQTNEYDSEVAIETVKNVRYHLSGGAADDLVRQVDEARAAQKRTEERWRE